MYRVSLLFCIALCMASGLTGCAGFDLAGMLLLKTDPAGYDRVVSGSLDMVATSTRESLTQLGLAADLKAGTGQYYIDSTTKSGIRFRLVLTRVETPAGEKTRISWEWLDNRQDSSHVAILGEVEKNQPRK